MPSEKDAKVINAVNEILDHISKKLCGDELTFRLSSFEELRKAWQDNFYTSKDDTFRMKTTSTSVSEFYAKKLGPTLFLIVRHEEDFLDLQKRIAEIEGLEKTFKMAVTPIMGYNYDSRFNIYLSKIH